MASIKKRPDGRWRARYRDPDGREHARHFIRKSDAERWLANIQSDIARGGYRDPAAARTTFKEYAEKWRAQQPHRPGTSRLYERTLRLHVYPVIGARQLGALRRSDIQGLVAGMVSSEYKPKTIENVVRLVRAVLNAAVDDGIIATSPHRKVTRPPVEHRHVVPRPLDGRRAADVISPRMSTLVLLSVGTGLRQGEALGLTVDRVNLAASGVAQGDRRGWSAVRYNLAPAEAHLREHPDRRRRVGDRGRATARSRESVGDAADLLAPLARLGRAHTTGRGSGLRGRVDLGCPSTRWPRREVISVLHYWGDKPLRWFQSARRHRVGRAHALHVMTTNDPTVVPATAAYDERLEWIGVDDRGVELEITALVLADAVVVIHVMPTALRRLP